MADRLPLRNLSVSSVRNMLGVSTTNIGALCTSPNINMWSKHKPVRDPRIAIDSFSDIGVTSDGMFGLNIPKWEGDDTLLTTYAIPRGSQYSEPYRLGDFRIYMHEKVLPITLSPQPDSIIIVNDYGGGLLSDDTYTSPAYGGWDLSLEDFGMQLCAFYYEHSDNRFIGWAPSLYYSLGGPYMMNVDVKFGLIPTDQAADLEERWYTKLPSSSIDIYELPRENATQNKNWVNVPTYVSAELIREWNVIIKYDVDQLLYAVSATYSFPATIVIREKWTNTTVYEFNVSVTANDPSSGYITLDPMPLDQEKSYIAYLYDGDTLKDIIDL